MTTKTPIWLCLKQVKMNSPMDPPDVYDAASAWAGISQEP